MDLRGWPRAAWSLWETLTPEQQLVGAAGAAAAILLLLAIWFHVAARSRTRDVAAVLESCVRGSFVPTTNRARVLRGDVHPPPDPFHTFSVELALHGPLSLIPALGRQTLTLSGRLMNCPSAELVWQRGRTPARALGRGAETRLWISRRHAIVAGEFAVRGVDTGALEYAWSDQQTRFWRSARSARILADAQPDFEIVFEAGALGVDEIPALIATVRALARAALGGLPR